MATRTSPWFFAAKIRRLACRRFAGRFAAGLVIVGIGATLSGVPLPLASATTTAGPEVGVVGDITWGTSPADIDRTIASMAAAGVRWVRANNSWSGGEPDAKGVLNQGWLVQIDYAVTKAQAAGIKVLMPIADGVPYWASADPAKYTDASGNHWNKYWRPTNASDYADFARAMVNRYKALGVHTYEVWNEPNTSNFWPSGPSAAEYTTLLTAAYPAIKAADPTATVLLGGLSKNDYNYLGQLYAAGAAPYFDAVAIHPYVGSSDPTWCWNQAGTNKLAVDAFCGIAEVHNTMVANGDSAKRIWLTEFGWSTTTAAYGVSEATQAQFLTEALDSLRTSYPYVQTAFWYNFRNNFWSANAPADYEANLGLLRVDFSAKPAYAALQAWTGGAVTSTSTTVAPTTTTTVALTTTTTATKLSQTIQFGSLANRKLSKSQLVVSATATSSLAVLFTSKTPTVCTASGTNGKTITLLGKGTCQIAADQAGNAVYDAAPQVTRGFQVT